MINSLKQLKDFRRFLRGIPLSDYREELIKVKWVEQDLPKELRPLHSIFQHYWDEMKLPSFEDWFEAYWKELNEDALKSKALETFKKYYFNRELGENGWFKAGYRARMYRTWVSLLTQLDFCYVARFVAEARGIGSSSLMVG